MTAAVSPGVVPLQSGSATSRLLAGAAEVFGLALLAAGLAAAVAVIYRWYARERVPGGFPVLVGISGVAAYMNSTTALRQVIGNTGDPLDASVALINIATVLVSLVAARAGTEVGDHVGTDVFATSGARGVETDVGRIVQAVGRVITVELPEDVDDIVGYDPVPDETKESLAGKSFVFPRRLTVAELRDRLVARLKADYAVGHVDIDLADDGSVEYLALGSRAAGIGPTLPPETSAVAIRADPAFAASAGDLVQVWRTDPMERVLTAELRGKVDDVVTLAVDAADTRKLADDANYRLVTLPVETRPDREFASMLRAADETMAAVSVAGDSPLAGQPLGALDVTVVAVRPADGPVEALPGRDRRLAAGDSLYLVATPEVIRKVEESVRPGGAAASPGSTMPPDKRVDAATPVAGESREPTRRGTAAGSNSQAKTGQAGEAGQSDESGQSTADPDAVAAAQAGEAGSRTGESPDQTDDSQSAGPDDSQSGGSGDSLSRGADDSDRSDSSDDSSSEETDDFMADAPGIEALEPDDEPSTPDESASDEGIDVSTSHDGADESTSDEEADETAADDGDDSSTGDGPFELGDPDLTDLDGDEESDDGESADDGDSADDADAGSDDDSSDGESADRERSELPSDWKTLDDDDEPTRDDLSDLPGTDPADLTGTDVDEFTGSGSSGNDETDADADDADTAAENDDGSGIDSESDGSPTDEGGGEDADRS